MPYETVTPDRLRRFLERLAREYRRPGKVYLVGGTGLLYQGLKAATKDVDLSTNLPASSADEFTQALRRLRNELQMAIEEVSPADFIPLPRGVEERHRYLGRAEQLEIFAFDPVSTALAKLARSRVQDIEDVLVLLQEGQLTLDALDTAFEEIIPRVAASKALKITEDEFRVKFTLFKEIAALRGLA